MGNLTNSQKSIWVTEQYYKGSSINNICGTAVINEKIDLKKLEESITIVCQKHDNFWLKINIEDGKIKQVLSERKKIQIDVINVASSKELEEERKKIVRTPFKIENSELFKFYIFKFKNGEGAFMLNIHHLISDAWTLAFICNEIIKTYSALKQNQEIEKKAIYSYIDYIKSEQEYQKSEKFQKDKEYWEKIFQRIPEVATIPGSVKENIDKNEPAGERKQYELKSKDVTKIKEYCKKNKISLYNFFMAVYGIYIGEISNLDEFVIGTPILNRTNFKEKNSAGMFINMIPFKINMCEEQDFKTFIKNIAVDSMNMLKHQKYSYQCLLETLRERDRNIPNLYDILLSYQITNAQQNEGNIKYKTEWTFNGCCAENMDIQIYDLNDTGSLNIAYDYKTSIYKENDIENIHNRILNIIEQVISKEDIMLNEIEIVTIEEKKKLITEFNKTELKYDKNIPIIKYFEEQAKKTPDNIAIVFEDKKITYKELNERANSLAYLLRENEVSNNTVVGILLERSLEMLISILAVLKSGGSYIPIAPDYPKDRIEYMLEDSDASIILTSQNRRNLADKKLINVKDIKIYEEHKENLENISRPEDLSYLIYTSGSTGTPKGVMLKQYNLSNFYNSMKNIIEYLKDGKNHKILSITTVSFDIFGFETLMSLTRGLTVYLTNENQQKMTSEIERIISTNNVEIMQTTPSVMKFHLENMNDKSKLKSLKYIMLAGEPLPKTLVDKIKEIIPNVMIYNGYGPSETTIFSTVADVTNKNIITIGRPINNTQIYILNKNKKVLPQGTVGEIYISGDGVGKGYMNKEQQTKKSFIPNPFLDGKIMYKVGDLGAFDDDGEITCFGRVDNQVKIRGLRIELQEIEKRIQSVYNIRDCVVAKKEVKGKEALCAYYVENGYVTKAILKSVLYSKLPEYMVPQYFVRLDKLPYTPNGKVDRKALPEPNLEKNDKLIVKSRNDIDTELIKIIEKMLHVQNASIEDSLLDLGGDSLSAITLSTKILSRFNVQINIKDILSNFKIKDMSDFIRKNKSESIKRIKIEKTTMKETYPISSAQKRIYYNAKMIGEKNIVYNVPGGILVDEILNKERVEKVFDKIIERHETLRTEFILENNNIVQKIKKEIDLKIPVYNNTESEIQEIISQFSRPFELEKGQLIRVEIHYIDKKKTLLLMESHHIVMDGTSLNNLIIEFERLYNGKNLKKIPIQYKDYAVWENRFNESKEIKRAENYWVNKFKDSDFAQLNLPYDYKIPMNRSYKGNKIVNVIDEKKFRKIERYAKKIGVSPYMLFISAFFILLYKYTGQEEIILGSPFANRNINETKRIIGMFVNNIVVKGSINPEETFQDFLIEIKEQILDDLSNQPYPFDMLIKKLGIKSDNSRNPLFDVMFTYQNKEENSLMLDNKETQVIEIDNRISKFNLSLEVKPKSHTINLEYCRDLFKKQTIEKMFEHYMNIINNIIVNNDVKIKDIEIISECEKNKILYDFNNTKMNYQIDKTISELVEEQVKKSPNKIAVVFENRKISYKQLNEKANQLANYLIDKGIKSNDKIGVMLPRGLEIFIAFLGIQKAGACYIPIDPTYPEKRIEYMLENSQAKLLITTEELYNNIKFENKICINSDKIIRQKISNLKKISLPDDIAYIIYTSGSTGLPKGVKITNKNLVNFVIGVKEKIDFDENKTMVSITTICFDIFGLEIWCSLTSGLTVIIANEEEQHNPALLNKLCIENNVNIIQTTPSRYAIMMEEKENVRFLEKVTDILVGGEPISEKILSNLQKNSKAKIFNMYGPTETTIWSTIKELTNENVITIGRPIANTQVYVLNKNLQVVPIGVTGELYIAGDGVGAGYLNREDITKERYIKNPFLENSVMYKTGDICKFDSQGELYCLGRIDNQIKIRGLRVELEEIENKILENPCIKKVHVVKQEIGNREIISAYYISKQKVEVSEIRAMLQKTLPSYMIPSYFTELDKFPYTPNGKIDKNELVKMINVNESKKTIIKPTNQMEMEIADIFKNVLELDDISIDDNFFELGGDSISAMKIQIEASRKNINITYGQIFEYPTVRGLAENIQISNKTKNMITKVEHREYYPVSSAQKRMYIVSNMEEKSDVYNINGGILLNGSVNLEKLQNAMDEIVEKNEILKTYFEVKDGGEIIQKIDDNCTIRIHTKYAQSNDIQKIFEETKKTFDLSKAPLLDANLLLLPNGKTLLMLSVHHIIFDGTSLKLLLQELAKLYDKKDIEEPLISYKDYAVWEENQLSGDKLEKSKNYWKNKFIDGTPILNMPSTYPRPPIKSYEGNTFNIIVSERFTKKIIEFSKARNVTPYMFLLTCYYILLYKYTGQENIIVGSPISGRTHKELENVLGMFVNTLPLKNTVISEEKFENLLEKVKENLLKAYECQDYPFDLLVNELNIARDNSRTPLFDTMFIYQSDIFSTVEFNGENAKYYIPESHTSKYDLSLEAILIDNKLQLSFEYWTKLFDERFINELANHYINIISNVIEERDITISDISIISKKEKEKILYEFNDTKMEYNKDETIIQLFEEQVRKTPNNTAIVFEDSSITYKELNERANQLAHYLINNGIKDSSVIGIMLPRGIEVLVSMIGVLKTGASYIPIDPELPSNRIEYMLNNSKAVLVLTNQNENNILKINQVNVSLDNKEVYNGNLSNINIKIDTNNQAYMIYTSGSTGLPKGVVLKHKSLTNLTNFLNNKVQFLQDRYSNMAIASITTISFDIFIFETLICLQRGLKIVMANEQEQNTPNLLDSLIARNNVRAIQMTPSRMYIFINNKNIMPHLKNLKYIILAGEALPKELKDKIREIGDITVYNGYGPSETTVFSTFTDVTKYDEITIGKPLANTRIYILDKDKNICPICCPGEIYIAGDGVGIGYCNNKEMTRERFIKDEFYENEIMYKTGDLGMYLPNGEIHYIGRVDNQIKIRGLRIELDEIEKSILKYPNVDKCIITSYVDNNNRQFIVAYLTVTNRISTNKLRAFLKTMLPKYMIPSYFVILDKIPYLNNGKIDKKALPKVDIESSKENKKAYVAPRGNLELQLVNAFQNTLAISPIGIDDNFFELGGDSLLAINLQVELMKMKINITYPEIFENPTVRELASKIAVAEKNTFSVIDKNEFVGFEDILKNTCNRTEKIDKVNIKNIFLTGVTGFLGAHVLDTFLKKEKGIVYCAIRKEPGLTLEEKILNKLKFYFGNKYNDYLGKRIIIVNADLTQNELGMSNENIEKIFKDIDCVINCAAKVSHYGKYDDYKKINVKGTENLLKLCMKYNKRFYQISTLSVSGNSLVDQSYIEQSFKNDVIFRESNFYINQSLDNVYVRSKFEAEKMVLQYINKGVNGYICRVGNLMNRFSDGKFQPNVDENAFIERLNSLAKIGCIPDYILKSYMEFTPVDCCAEAIIKLVQYPTHKNRIFHLYNNNHVNTDDFIKVLRKYKNISVVSNTEFLDKIDKLLTQKDFSNILSGILRDFDKNRKLVYESKIKLDAKFTNEYLSKINFKWPQIDGEYLKKFINYFCQIGYITKEEN